MENTYKVIGLMSGTSLDGLDIAYCKFVYNLHLWYFGLEIGETIPYTAEWKEKLATVEQASALEYAKVNANLGAFFGKEVAQFVKKHDLEVDFVASHGHTIFHQPDIQLTTQIGSGAAIAAHAQLPVVCDFRTTDVALGGQGAPLVPIGDKLLFADYDFCLNLGGIANISFDKEGKRIAYDIAPVNMVMNALAKQMGKEYDDKGNIAKSGSLNAELFAQLNELDFYKKPFPKSIGKEWVLENVFPLVENSPLSVADKLCTFTHHAAFQIAQNMPYLDKPQSRLLVTGGGAFNTFLIDLIKNYDKNCIVEIPNEPIIQFKEALIFAFLGVLRWRNEPNCLQSVTGAVRDNCGGAIYW